MASQREMGRGSRIKIMENRSRHLTLALSPFEAERGWLAVVGFGSIVMGFVFRWLVFSECGGGNGIRSRSKITSKSMMKNRSRHLTLAQ